MAPPVPRYTRVPPPGNPARSEAWALIEAARQIEDGKSKGREALLAAVRLNWQLWTIFQASLIDEQCTMPAEPRGNLLRLANFIDRRTVKILANPEPHLADVLVTINRNIGEGLLEGARAAAAQAQAPAQAPTPAAGMSLRESA